MKYYSSYNPTASIFSIGFVSIVMLFSVIIGLAVSIGIGYLIYKDAKKHNIENPLL